MLLTEYLNQLRQRTEKVGIAAVASKLGIQRNSVNNFVTGKNCTEKTMRAVEAAVIELEEQQ